MAPSQFQWTSLDTTADQLGALVEPSSTTLNTSPMVVPHVAVDYDAMQLAQRQVAPQVVLGQQPMQYQHPVMLAPMPIPAASHGATPVIPMRRRDGAIGLSIGLVLLAATLSGAVALGFMGQRIPAATTTPAAPAASVAAAAPATATPDAAALPTTPAGPASAPGSASTTPPPTKTAQSRRVSRAANTSRNQQGSSSPAPTTNRPAASGGGSSSQSNASTSHASSSTNHATTTKPPTTSTQVQPTTRQPVSYSVSTPGGAHWTSPVSEYDAVKNGVPNATITPNY